MILEICSFPVKNNFANVYWTDSLKIHWMLSTILKTSKKMYEVMLSDM